MVFLFNSSETIFQIHRLRTQSHKNTFSNRFPMPIRSPGCYLCFWGLAINQRFPHPLPCFGSINLPGWLAELRKTVYLLKYQFIIKSHNSGTARWKSCIRQGMGKRVQSFCALSRYATFSAPPHVHEPRSSLSHYFRDFYVGFIMQTWIIKLLAISD